jgi:polyhydroxyalkanoate synthase
MGLSEYADRMILAALDAIAAETEQPRAFIAGHSLGGTLAAIFASLHADRLHGLISLEGPIQFNAAGGKLESAVAAGPSAKAITDVFGNVPGAFLSAASSWADPGTFASEPMADRWQCWASPSARRVHWHVRRWTLDETPMPQRLFEEVVDGLYRANRFATGTLTVGPHRADPQALTAPILAVTNVHSQIVPATSIDAYRAATGSRDVQILEYAGDVGVVLQHLGVLVGKSAHAELWPRILDWIQRHHHR